jgi:flagellin
VNITVMEQARRGALQINGIDTTEAFNLRLIGQDGEDLTIYCSPDSYSKMDIINAVNAETDRTGVQARSYGTGIVFETLEIGSKYSVELVDFDHIGLNITDMAGKTATTDAGRDVWVKINGHTVQGDGRQIKYASGDLEMSATISSSMKVGERTQFQVAGGALFQLGKNVQTTMQYRLALPSMMVSNLGGATGNLSKLREIDLDTDEGKALAYAIVTEAVNKVAVQRGTIGAVQRSVIESNAKNLDFQLERVSESEALISNADMALESSRLNRAEILAQSTMSAILYAQRFGQFIISSLL